jgi:hypothetical protein
VREFLAVDLMRRGAPPLDAIWLTLRRIVESYPKLRKEHQVALVALHRNGQYASAALRPGYKTSVVDRAGSNVIEPDAVELGRRG